jgi:hypothetical protein
MSDQSTLIKRFRFYWETRNGKFAKQIRPTTRFLAKHLRKLFPRGEFSEKVVNASPGSGKATT